jgi:4-alpha-glucanotransferase
MWSMRSPLRDVARAAGIEASYTSWRGQPVNASDEAVQLALNAIAPELGVDVTKPDAVEQLERAKWAQVVPPVVLAWDGVMSLPLTVRADVDGEWSCEVELEGGGVVHGKGRLFELPAEGHAWPGGVVHCLRRASIWLEGALGYHTVRWQCAGEQGEALVIAAPSKAYGQPGLLRKRWGVFAPVYGLASPESGEAGDLATLAKLVQAVERRGGSYVSTLPLLAAFLDEPFAASPYSPASRLFWNELYLDLHKVADDIDVPVPAPPPIVADKPIDYRAQYRWRRPVIDRIAAELMTKEMFRGGIAEWARETGVYDYAAFRAIGEKHRTGWQSWPAEHRRVERMVTSRDEAVALGADGARVDSHVVAQWLMQNQLEQLHGGPVTLYLDLPVGVNGDAYEVWRWPQLFLGALSAGAPPDPLFLGGQSWGLPPLSPFALRRDRYRYFIRSVRHHMRVAGMLRIDHVMGLFRLYCVPHGRPATDGVYIKYPHEELLAILTLESTRAFCAVTGEDLGTVPDHVRPAMHRHGLYRLHVGQWAFPSTPGKAPDVAPAESVASLNTHDTATFAGWWRADDITDMRDLGLITPEQEHKDRQLREQQKTALLAFAKPDVATDSLTDVERAMVAAVTDLAVGPAEVVLVALDDLALDPVPHNVPGTVHERPNWQRRVQGWATSLDPEGATPPATATLTALTTARPAQKP